MGKCLIFGAGERVPAERVSSIENGDLVIAADGGLSWIAEEFPSVLPNVILGDFDSLPEQEGVIRAFLTKAKLEGAHLPAVMKYPVEKDDTDTGIAVVEGLARGYREFVIYGGTGGRMDHTLANMSLLLHIALKGGHGFLVSPAMCATAYSGKAVVRGVIGETFSVFATGEGAEGVSIRGAKYEVEDAALKESYALGVSNSFSSEETVVSAKKGTLLMVGEFLPEDVSFSE
ncbi:MAG: thiamine diphosphokinase [Lachnospiraceae bacterium]|nr:thiamine diphosphokinase [Lachnospiraceae bacterium]